MIEHLLVLVCINDLPDLLIRNAPDVVKIIRANLVALKKSAPRMKLVISVGYVNKCQEGPPYKNE